MPAPRLLAAVGDIHGRFLRVEGWLTELARAHGRPVDAALAVGDVETFAAANAPLRKRTKREGAAEFSAYARGERAFPCPVYFIGGNNEDFVALHAMPEGGELAPGVRYLGRAGATEIAGLRVGYLSGIFAPKSLDLPLQLPTSLELARRAGHFRSGELDRVRAAGAMDLLLVHDWPRGIIPRGARLPAGVRPPPPFWGSLEVRQLIDALRPPWVLCGHQHRAWAATLGRANQATRIACLDEAEQPDAAILWMEVEGKTVVSVGWGTRAEPAWRGGEPWDPSRVPAPGGEPAAEPRT